MQFAPMTAVLPLFDHLAWADARTLAAIGTLDVAAPERAEAARLYAHLAAAEHVWCSRLQGRAPQHAVWPELPLEAARELSMTSIDALREFAAGDDEALARVVDYRTTTGVACRDTVHDILVQVALHGAHHRGQIALLVRRGGGTPEPTDWIVYARSRTPRSD